MQTLSTLEFLIRLVVGVGCGALIGAERQWRARTAGLRTNALVAAGATLFVLYSDIDGSANSTQVAAYVVSGVGVLAASGRLVFALVGTIAVIGVHLLGRPVGRLIDPDNAAEEHDYLHPYELQIICKPKSEPRIRALIVQETDSSEVVLSGVDTARTDDVSQTQLTAHLLIDGDAALLLERLVARLSLEPGIHGVRWRSADEPDFALTLPESREESASSNGE
jgi:putative Mg2+ transporter-C (MgtC) family protein